MDTYTLQAPLRFGADRMARPQPDEVGEGQVMVKILAGGICGSDLPYARGATKPAWRQQTRPGFISKPGAPMHEIVGEITVSKDPGHGVGDLVVGWSLDYEGLRPYLVVPGTDVAGYDPRWQTTEAINLQPLACVWYAVQRIGDVRGRHVAVIGQGPIGVLFTNLLSAAGAARVTGVDPVDHSEAAYAFGADEFVHLGSTRWAEDLSEADKPAVVVEAAGHDARLLNDAVNAAAFGGLVFGFGVPDDPAQTIDYHTFLHRDLRLMAGLTRDKHACIAAADRHLQAHPQLCSLLTTDLLGFDQVQHAFERASVAQPGRLKVVLSR